MIEHRVAQLADYLISTLADEHQKQVHDESCDTIVEGNPSCDCDATDEWQATIAAIMAAVDHIRHLDDTVAALVILKALAKPYEKGSGYPR